MISIVCWKWSPQGPPRNRVTYTADHVNRFASMVDRHVSQPHEIVCITDDAEGIDGGVRIVPMWDDLREYGMCYTRLKAFAPEMADVIGPRFLSVDLDCVIVNSLDPIITDESFKAWENVGRGSTYCGSMFMMDAGARSQVWDTFNPNDLVFHEERNRRSRRGNRYIHPRSHEAGNVIGSDQAWISTVLGPNEARWTREDGVLSYSDPAFGRSRLGVASYGIQDWMRVIFFHGIGDPSQRKMQRRYPWITKHWC